MDYDVIIAGGSFAGLAVAAQLRGRRVLLIEPHTIGSHQTSACGTLLAVLKATHTMESLLQVHDRLVLHLGRRVFEYPVPYPFCTFDFAKFCRALLAQTDADLLHASVQGHRGRLVVTTRGLFDAEILVDATGWRAALSTNGSARASARPGKSFGVETVLPVSDDGLHFYYDPDRLQRRRIGWLFPIGRTSRAGIGSYRGESQLRGALEDFVGREFDRAPNGRHGGFFPYRRQPATTGAVFRVGDAAGQCLPLTGEGIRPALYYGAIVGRLARRVLEEEMSQTRALRDYRRLVRRHARAHRWLLAGQQVIPGLPVRSIDWIARGIQDPGRFALLMRAYWRAADPDEMAREWASAEAVAARPRGVPAAMGVREKAA